ncbi:MAG TPA: hypothetical protein VF374_00415 [Thermoplasmata archaeon]
MLTWRQIRSGYMTTCRLSENGFFARLGLRSGWEKVILLRFSGRGVCFVYPMSVEAADPWTNSIL